MYGWWDKSTTREERRQMRRKALPILTSLPTWLVLTFGAALLIGFMVVLWMITDSSRMIAGFSLLVFVVCLIFAVSRLRRHFEMPKSQGKHEHTHHGE